MRESPQQQRRRLQSIERLELLLHTGDAVLTNLTSVAAHVTGASAAAVHIVDGAHQHRIAATGAPLDSVPAEHSMCLQVVRSGERVVLADGSTDPAFCALPATSGPDGQFRFYAAVPLRISDGSVVGTLCAFDLGVIEIDAAQITVLESLADVARAHLELVRVAADLGLAATTDPLTSALNRTVFQDRAAAALARRPRHGTTVVMVIFDVDDFKQVNDTRGHDYGDQALRWTAQRIRSVVREEDTVGRLGGDEFALVAEITGSPEALLTTLREAFLTPDAPVSVTIGAAVAEPNDDVRALLIRADGVMYAAKRQRQAGRLRDVDGSGDPVPVGV